MHNNMIDTIPERRNKEYKIKHKYRTWTQMCEQMRGDENKRKPKMPSNNTLPEYGFVLTLFDIHVYTHTHTRRQDTGC